MKHTKRVGFWLLIMLLALAMVLAACGSDDDDDNGDDTGDDSAEDTITVSDAWVRGTVPMEMDSEDDIATDEAGDSEGEMGEMGAGGGVTGAFMIISNSGDEDERLVSVSVSEEVASMVEIHETTLNENDVMEMREVDGIDVPADGNTVLKPGGYHIMLIDLQATLYPGDTVPMTLTFASGKEIVVEAEVREITG